MHCCSVLRPLSVGLSQFVLKQFWNRIGIVFHTYTVLTENLQIHSGSDPTAFRVICITAKLPFKFCGTT